MKALSARKLPKGTILPLVVLGLTLAACDTFESDNNWGGDQDVLATATIDETIGLTGQNALYLQNVNGNVAIERSVDATSVHVEAELIAGSYSRGDAESWLDKLRVHIEKRVRTVAVETDFPRDSQGRRLEVRYRVQVPSGFAVEIDHVNGTITVNDMVGHVDIEHVNGRVEINNLRGTINVHVVNGTIDCEVFLDQDGSASLHAVNGEIRLDIPKSTSAQLHAETSNGRVDFKDLSLTNESGNSRSRAGLMGEGKGHIELTVINGSIEVKGM